VTTTHPVVFDPYDHATQDDPYPVYARLREDAPFHHDPERGFWALSRHADVTAALRDEATFSNRMGVSIDPASWGPQARYAMSFLAMDPPEQTRLRALVSRGFTPRRVKELEPRIQVLTDEYLRPLIDDGASFDFIDEFAGRLPMDVISEMMGVPKDDRAELRRLADLLIARPEGSRDVPPAGIEAALALLGYFQDVISTAAAVPVTTWCRRSWRPMPRATTWPTPRSSASRC